MREIRYSVAMSLDGYIATRDGGYDWLPTDIGIDWNAFMNRFDTVLLGRKTYEVTSKQGGPSSAMRTYVFSRTLAPEVDRGATVTGDFVRTATALREENGKEIWLMGGGSLFSSALDAGLVDLVEVAVIPVVLGDGIPVVAPLDRLHHFDLESVTRVSGGVVMLAYRPRRST